MKVDDPTEAEREEGGVLVSFHRGSSNHPTRAW